MECIDENKYLYRPKIFVITTYETLILTYR